MKRNMGCREDVNLNCFDVLEDLYILEEVGIFFWYIFFLVLI